MSDQITTDTLAQRPGWSRYPKFQFEGHYIYATIQPRVPGWVDEWDVMVFAKEGSAVPHHVFPTLAEAVEFVEGLK